MGWGVAAGGKAPVLEHGLALKQEQFMKQQSRKARMRSRAERRKDLADACLKMRIDVTLTFPSTDEKIAAECKSTSWCKSHAPRRMRSGGRYSGRFATTVDYVAKKARIDRGDKADLIDNEGFEGRPTIRRALATLGTIEGYAVGGCCDLWPVHLANSPSSPLIQLTSLIPSLRLRRLGAKK